MPEDTHGSPAPSREPAAEPATERPGRHGRWRGRRFDPGAVTRAASDALNVRRVFGEAYERDGTLVIPVAAMYGGTGSGFGMGDIGGVRHGDTSQSEREGVGGGGGFGIRVRPIGVYVIDDAGAHWRPTVDVNRVVLGGQAVGIVVAISLSWALRRSWRQRH